MYVSVLQQILAYKFYPNEQSVQEEKTKGEGTDDIDIVTESTERPETLNLSFNSKDSSQFPVTPLDFHSGHFDTTPSENPNLSFSDSGSKPHPLSLANMTDKKNADINFSESNSHLESPISIHEGNVKDSRELDYSELGLPGSFSNLDLGRREEKSCHLLDGEFRLLWQQSFSDPVFAIDSLDITGDGLEDLVVLSQKGIHVLQVGLSLSKLKYLKKE